MNIFARELSHALAAHGKELSNLYSVKSDLLAIPPSKVTRLKGSLTHNHTATLNADELELLRVRIPLSDDEMRRLRAALVAETVRYMLAGRMLITLANQIAELVFELLIAPDTQQMHQVRDFVLEQIRGVAPGEAEPMAPAEAEATDLVDAAAGQSAVERALEPAIRQYEYGALWLEYARDATSRGVRLSALELARALLARARALAVDAAAVAAETPEQAELLELIDAALAEAELLE